jgi:hypothetical protein
MRIFWVLVVLLAAGTAAAVFWPAGPARLPAQPLASAGETATAAEVATPTPAAAATPSAPADTTPSPTVNATAATPSAAAAAAPATPAPVAAPEPTTTPAATPAATASPASTGGTGGSTGGPTPPPAAAKLSLDEVLNVATGNAPPAAAAAAPASAPAPGTVPAGDGKGQLIDNRFLVKGTGSEADPYVITWEMLVSAQETYDPAAGKKDIPARITMLDGKFVKVTGYVAFPLAVAQPKELLSMLNQWDGCCIGVPPSPYDAVEVHLKNRVIGEDRMATFGTVEGKMTVKPYVVGDWLVGLYLLSDAAFTPTQYGTGPASHQATP